MAPVRHTVVVEVVIAAGSWLLLSSAYWYIAFTMIEMSVERCVLRCLARTVETETVIIVVRMAIIAMTTRISINVNPGFCRRRYRIGVVYGI